MKLKLFGRVIEIKKRASSPESDLSQPAPWLYEAFGGVKTKTGISVNEETSLKFSAVYACVRVISEAIASMPKNIYRRVDERTRELDSKHPCQTLIHLSPSELYSSFDFFDTITATVLLWGNAFAIIKRDVKYKPVEFELIQPKDVKIIYQRLDNSKKVLLYEIAGYKEPFAPYDILHFKGLGFDGVQGKSVIQAFARESIGLGIAVEEFGARYFGNDTLITKVLEHPGTLSETAYNHIKNSWIEKNAGLDNAFKIDILEEGMKLNSVSIPADQAQFLETRHLQIEEICRWFKVQPHLIQHLLRSTNNNIEHQGIEFSTHTIIPWVVRFEQELNRKLFTEAEKKDRYVKFNMNILLRGDITARTAYYVAGRQWGWLSANDVLAKEDENPIKDGDRYLEPMNMTVPGQTPAIPNKNNHESITH